jgi:hypothetical protein
VTNDDLIDLHNNVSLNYSKIVEWSDLMSGSSNSDGGLRALINQVRKKPVLGS